MADVLILNYNDSSTVNENVERIKNYKNINHILIVDNCSTDNSIELIKNKIGNKTELIVSDKNGGYGYGNNFGINYMVDNYKSKYILLMNPDTIIDDDTVGKLEEFLKGNKEYAIVAPYMLNKNKEKQFNTAFRIPKKREYIISLDLVLSKILKSFYYKNLSEEKGNIKDVGIVSGSLFMFDSSKMKKYGMYDENIFLYGEEMVLGTKMEKANQKVALLLNETFIHNHSISISKTYKSGVAKRKILNKSKLYIIKQYYNANTIEMLLAKILSILSIAETYIISLLRRCKSE